MLSITYNKVGKLVDDRGNDLFENEMNAGYSTLILIYLYHACYMILITVIEADGFRTLLKAIFGYNTLVNVSTKHFLLDKKYDK